MTNHIRPIITLTFLLVGSLARAESSDLSTAVGTVEMVEKETVTITLAEKTKKTVVLKVTGTSNFFLLTPQVRSGKTVITQRKAEATDLTKGQSIAVIYTEADKESVLLNAVMKPVEKK